MNHAKHILHAPLHTCSSSYNHTQPTWITRETSNIQNTARSHPASRSGWGVSLRRASPSPRRERQKLGHGQHGISLKRDPSRLGELPARSKIERAARATFRAKNLGELPVSSRLGEIDSLGRDLQVSSLFFTVTATKTNQTNMQSDLIPKSKDLKHTSRNPRNHRPKLLENKSSNFPYLEKSQRNFDAGPWSTVVRVMDLRSGGTAVDTIIFGFKRWKMNVKL